MPKFDCNWPVSSGEKDFQFLSMHFLLICYHLPLEKDVILHLTSLSKHALCQVWFWLTNCFWRQVIRKAHLSFRLMRTENIYAKSDQSFFNSSKQEHFHNLPNCIFLLEEDTTVVYLGHAIFLHISCARHNLYINTWISLPLTTKMERDSIIFVCFKLGFKQREIDAILHKKLDKLLLRRRY